VNSGTPKLNISIDVERAPDPWKYTNSGQERPTEREIIVREHLLEHKFVTNNLNIQKSNIGLECHIEKDVIMKQDSYTCKKCKDRNDPNHFIKKNSHPLCYEIEEEMSQTPSAKTSASQLLCQKRSYHFTTVMLETVFTPNKNYRVKSKEFSDLLGRLGMGEPTQRDAELILNLHIGL
jgi:hypothetical protein